MPVLYAPNTVHTAAGEEIGVLIWTPANALDKDDLIFAVQHMNVAIIRGIDSDRYMGSSAGIMLTYALERMGTIPSDAEALVYIGEYRSVDDSSALGGGASYRASYIQRLSESIEKAPNTSDVIKEVMNAAANYHVIYDCHGEFDAIIPKSAFTEANQNNGFPSYGGSGGLARRNDSRWSSELVFVGNLDECCDTKERADLIRAEVEMSAATDFIQEVIGERFARGRYVEDDKIPVEAQQVFDCICLGFMDFPLDSETYDAVKEKFEIAKQNAPWKMPINFLNVFYSPEIQDIDYQNRIGKYQQAYNLFMDSLLIWTKQLNEFGVPLDIRSWGKYLNDKENWNVENMKALGELLGVEQYIDALSKGVPIDALLCGSDIAQTH